MREPWMDEQDRQNKMERRGKHLPHCEDCECVIYDFGYKVNGLWYCEDCMRKGHYREVEEYGE